jgi:hypothetical protein
VTLARLVNWVISAANSGVSSSKALHTDRAAPLDRFAVMPPAISVRYDLASSSPNTELRPYGATGPDRRIAG